MAELSQDVINTIIAEAGGDGRKGMEAVAWAIANRAAKGNKTPEQVVKAKGQFEGYSNPGSGSRKAQQDPNMVAKAKDIWDKVQSGSIPDPLQGGTMFHSSNISPYWADAENKHGTVKIGNQTYYLGGSALPPMNIPQVASELDTKRPAPVPADKSNDMRMMTNPVMSAVAKALQVTPPKTAPSPAIQSDDMRLMRNPVMSIAAQQAQVTPFPAEKSQDMRLMTNPVMSSVANAAQTTGNSIDPGLRAALAAKLNPVGQPPATRLVQSVPVPPKQQDALTGMLGRGLPAVQRQSYPFGYSPQTAAQATDALGRLETPAPDALLGYGEFGSTPSVVAKNYAPMGSTDPLTGKPSVREVAAPSPVQMANALPPSPIPRPFHSPIAAPSYGMGGVDINPKPRAAIFNVGPQQRVNAAYGPMARIQRSPIFSLLGGNKSPIANAVASVLINGGNNTQRQSTQSILDTTDHINGRAYAGQDMRGLV